MARARHTKSELKTQREAQRRFRRFLPTLELKKRQLELEVRRLDTARAECEARLGNATEQVGSWVRLFAEDVRLRERLIPLGARLGWTNVAGVAVPVFEGVDLERPTYDLHDSPAWIDDGLDALAQIPALRVELRVLAEARTRLADELRVTSQRVNLFEKIKIPETNENIRVIRIFLGDEQTAAVARAKLAKGRLAAAP